MEISNWIGKSISEIKENFLYKKYFESIPIENGIDVYYLLNRSSGIDLILNMDYSVKAIHFYSDEIHEEVRAFTDKLPFELDFSFSRDEVKNILGNPTESGGGDFSFLHGIAPQWDKYFFDNIALHLQFSKENDRIELVTLDQIRH